jgi:hypothetical protein
MMTLHKKIIGDVGTVHALLVVLVLIVSDFAGRQLFIDGANFIVQSLNDPFWSPHTTPKRFFAVIWTTAEVRLLGIVNPHQIQFAILIFGIAAFSQIAIPLFVVINSGLKGVIKSLILSSFLSATIFLANFVVTEVLFALAVTTIYIVYTLDPARDPKGLRRFISAFLLMASYEIVALSNILLAIGTYLSVQDAQRSTWRTRGLIIVLTLALPFQLFCYSVKTSPGGTEVFDWFVFAIIGLFATALAFGVLYFKLVGARHSLRTATIVLSFLIPISVFFVPSLISLRTREFQFAYPSRVYAASVTVFIAMLPILLDLRLWKWPSAVLDWIGERPLRDLSLATIAAFCGVSLLASTDAYLYRTRLEGEFSHRSGVVNIQDCDFCLHPTNYGLPDLGYPWIWPLYSMAYSIKRQDRPPVVMIGQGGVEGDMTREQIDSFMTHELAFRRSFNER